MRKIKMSNGDKHHRLMELSRLIGRSSQEGDALNTKALTAINAVMAERIMCGAYLSEAKQLSGRDWTNWLKAHRPEMSRALAERRIRLARRKAANATSPDAIRRIYAKDCV